MLGGIMAEIYRFAFPRVLFDQAPEAHRLGYLMLGQLWNDCVISRGSC